MSFAFAPRDLYSFLICPCGTGANVGATGADEQGPNAGQESAISLWLPRLPLESNKLPVTASSFPHRHYCTSNTQ